MAAPTALDWPARSGTLKVVREERDSAIFQYTAGTPRVDSEEALSPAYSDTLLRVRPPTSGPQRGVLIYVLPLLGGELVNPFVTGLRRAGWTIVEIPFFTVRSNVLQLDLGSSSEIPAAADRIAAAFDERLAFCAFAAESLLDYLGSARPDVRQDSIVVMGFSAGALAAPTIAARLHDRVGAIVLVCGGSNLLDITMRTLAHRTAVRVRVGGRTLSNAERVALTQRYLSSVHLDPYYSAHCCRDIPTLVVHGRTDMIVPADCGEALWERLGRPERWSTGGGHVLTTVALMLRPASLENWLDAHTRSSAAKHTARSR